MKSSERQKLKHDAYAEKAVSALGWARHHQTTIIVIFVGVVAIIGLAGYLIVSGRQAEQQAQDLLTGTRQEAAQASAAGKDDATREKAVVETVRKLDQLAQDYPDTDAAGLALLEAGQALLNAGKASESIPYFERALGKAGGKSGLAASARRGLAGALERTGKLNEAIEQYRRFATPASSPMGVMANFEIGRLYEQLGDVAKAKDAYTTAAEFGGETQWGKMARMQLLELAEGRVTKAPVAQPTATTTTLASATTTTAAPAASPTTIAKPVATTVPAPAK